MKIVLAFDSFKGCMTQQEVCLYAKNAILSAHPDFQVISIPMSDGGEGLSACLASYFSSHPVTIDVHGPLMKPVSCTYYISEDDKIAVMEMAAAAGLCLVPEELRNPMFTTTYGVGEMIIDAYDKGCRKIIMGIGGSATCDGGRGMVECIKNRLPIDVELTVACDVQNPLYGLNGAAYVYGPQKGANQEQVKVLNDRLISFADETVALGYAVPEDADFPGSGAAGGLGYALRAYLNASLTSGISLFMDIVNFDAIIQDADVIITGEGRSDYQTMMGKVPSVILKRAKVYDIPVILLSGSIENMDLMSAEGYTIVNSINYGDNRTLSELMNPVVARNNLERSILSVLNQL